MELFIVSSNPACLLMLFGHRRFIGLLTCMTLMFVVLAPPVTHAQIPGLSRNEPPIVTIDTQWNIPKAHAGDERILAVTMNIADGYHTNPNAAQTRKLGDFEPYASELTVVEAPLNVVGIESPLWPKPAPYETDYADGELMVYKKQATLFVKVKVLPEAKPGDYELKFNLHYQACTDTFCAPPTDVPFTATLSVVAAEQAVGQPTNPALFQTYEQAQQQTPAAMVQFDVFGYVIVANGLLFILIGAIFGGFLLNFTPCVLPVIPIKIMGLSQHAGSRSRTLLLGVIMSSGVIAFWLVMGLLVSSFKVLDATNELFGKPWFTISVGLFIAAMAIGMAGFFTIQLPKAAYMVNPNNQSAGGSFIFGIMTAILSLPCTAPFMGAALGWATQQSVAISLLTFLSIGLGMALPYLVLSANPKWVNWMPRTGPASELLKQVMGLLMLAAAMYFIGTGISAVLQSPPDPPTKLYWWPVMITVAAAAVWLIVRTFQLTGSPIRRGVFVVLALLAIAGSAYGGMTLTSPGPIKWVYYTPERFQQALDQGDVIVLDFTAEWCLNCKTLEHTQLNQQQVVDLLEQPGVVPMKIDITGSNPEGRAKLKEAGRLTIPLLVVYAPDGREVFKSDTYHAGQVVDAIEQARGQ